MPQILISPNLSKSVLFIDRLRRHGLYYATKLIEKEGPPRLVINSFWRSGSTLLLEFLADLFAMRPYFEPLTPREPKFSNTYNYFEQVKFNKERLHPIDEDGQIKNQLLTCTFQSKWVYQCQTRQNFRGINGKIMKLVTGAHVVPQLLQSGIPVLHLSRDVFKVAESFLNSKWTNRFFEGVDLSVLANSTIPHIAEFYAPYAEYLDLRKYSLIEQVAIYHNLTELYVRTFAPQARFVNYEDFLQKPHVLTAELSQILQVSFNKSSVKVLLSRPSRMTVHNPNKRELSLMERKLISDITDQLKTKHPSR